MISLATVTLPHVSGFAEDDVMNTFCISHPSGWDPQTELGDVTIPLTGFYNSNVFSTFQLSSFLSPGLSRASQACRIRLYDITDHLDGSSYGSPYAEDTFTLGAAGATQAWPEEVALCLTWRAIGWEEALVEAPDGGDAGSEVDRPRQRLSGRTYVGPFAGNVPDSTVAGRARPNGNLRSTMLAAAEHLVDQLAVAPAHTVCVWSRKNASVVSVSAAQVDDAWDTQRRRGAPATVRSTVTFIP